MTALELRPARDAAARLAKLPGAVAHRRRQRVLIEWLRAGEVLVGVQQGERWVERVSLAGWSPGAPVPRDVVAVPANAEPAGSFRGHERRVELGEVTAVLLQGTAGAGGIRRLRFEGPATAVEAACIAHGEALALEVPRRGLAAEALGQEPGASALDAAGATVREFVAALIPELAWPVLRWSEGARVASPEAVHQMRVAVRRLRSMLALLREPLACPGSTALRAGLRELAGSLGAARDWDVFLAGMGPELGARLDGAAAGRLLAAGRRSQAAARARLALTLSGKPYRALELRLACAATLRPWEYAEPPSAQLDAPSSEFAAAVLAHAYRRVRRLGRGFDELPTEALHELRKAGKRLRYGTEAFLPLFPRGPARRYARRLARLQETLGLLHDGRVAASLVAGLERAGSGYAGGWAAGLAAGREPALRGEARDAWKRFRAASPFWT